MSVSAIIPTYNRNDLLFSRSLASVLAQTKPVDEVLIVADGMDDQPIEDLQARVRVTQKTTDVQLLLWNIDRPDYPSNAGDFWSIQGYAARNFGLDHARGDWVAPLDDDDAWTSDHVELLLNAVTEKGVDFAYGRAATPFGQWYGYWPPSGMNFTDGSQLYRHDMGYRYDPEAITRHLPTDADLWNRMIAGGVTFTFVDQLVHNYYPNPR